jgi:hypothetical protein
VTTQGKAPNQARAFFIAYERCMERRPLRGGDYQMPFVPAVVCLAFSIELGLKALGEREGSILRGHQLDELFAKLSVGLQESLRKETGFPPGDFNGALSSASKTFVEWRYVHEQATPDVNVPFLVSLGRAVQNALP